MRILCVVAAAMLAIPFSVNGDPAQASKADKVREKPFTDSKVVVAIKSGQSVDIQKREGSWYFVKVGSKTGWAPMSSIRRTKPVAAASAGSLSTTATGRSSTGGVVSTTGVRGLDEEHLKSAAFSEEAVAAAEKNRVSPADAVAFAKAGGVQAHAVPPLSAPSTTGGKR